MPPPETALCREVVPPRGWAGLWGTGRLARVTADGDVTLHRLPGREPHGSWVEDRLVWVAMENGSPVAAEKGESA